jgi:hypothetical protein
LPKIVTGKQQYITYKCFWYAWASAILTYILTGFGQWRNLVDILERNCIRFLKIYGIFFAYQECWWVRMAASVKWLATGCMIRVHIQERRRVVSLSCHEQTGPGAYSKDTWFCFTAEVTVLLVLRMVMCGAFVPFLLCGFMAWCLVTETAVSLTPLSQGSYRCIHIDRQQKTTENMSQCTNYPDAVQTSDLTTASSCWVVVWVEVMWLYVQWLIWVYHSGLLIGYIHHCHRPLPISSF